MIFCIYYTRAEKTAYCIALNCLHDLERLSFCLSINCGFCVYKSQYKFSLEQDKYVAVLCKTKTFICECFRNPYPAPCNRELITEN